MLARLLGFDGDLAEARSERALWQQATALLPRADDDAPPGAGLPLSEPLPPQPADAAAYRARTHDDMAAYTQGLMDLGATVCSVRAPKCLLCPAGELCVARRSGMPERWPVKTRKTGARRQRESWWLWLEHDGRVLLRQRPPTGVWAGLWSLPLYDDAAALADAAAALDARIEPLPTDRPCADAFRLAAASPPRRARRRAADEPRRPLVRTWRTRLDRPAGAAAPPARAIVGGARRACAQGSMTPCRRRKAVTSASRPGPSRSSSRRCRVASENGSSSHQRSATQPALS